MKIVRYTPILILTLFALASHAQTGTTTTDTAQQINLSQIRQVFWDSLPKPSTWVNDFEGLYSDEESHLLDSIIGIFKVQTGIEIAIVTIDTLLVSKDKFDDLTLHIGNTWRLGEKGKDNGILIGISRGYKRMRIQNGYGIENLISDSETKTIIDNYFIPDFKAGNFFAGTLTGLTKLIDLLNTKRK